MYDYTYFDTIGQVTKWLNEENIDRNNVISIMRCDNNSGYFYQVIYYKEENNNE